MSLVCVCSAHGSPGVTTTALALAGVWPETRSSVFIEADSFGGVVAARVGLHDTPGLATLAAASRSGLDTETVDRHTQQLPGGIAVVVAPASAEQANAVLRDLAHQIGDWAAQETDIDVIVDCGRIGPRSPTLELIGSADRVLVLSRASVDQLRPAAHRVRALASLSGGVSLLLVGDEPYGADETASALQLPVSGVVAWDPDTAAVLSGGSGRGDIRLSLLVRSVATVAEELTAGLTPPPDGEEAESRLEPEVTKTSGEARV